MIDELEGYSPSWREPQGGGVAATAALPQEDPLAGYTPDWRKTLSQQPVEDPLADYTPEWNQGGGIKEAIIEGLKDQGLGLVQTMKYFISGMGHPGSGLLPPDAQGRVPFGKSILHRDQEAAAAGDVDAQKRLSDGATGAALIASTMAAGRMATGLKTGGGILAGADVSRTVRALRFVTAEATGGGVYGYIDPDGRDRGQAMAEDAIIFPIAGAALHGAFKGVGKVVRSFGWLGSKALPPEVTQALKDIKTEVQAEAVAKKTTELFDRMKPAADDQLTREEIVATQAAAVEAAVKGIDIPAGITTEGPVIPFPKITPVHRKVIRTFFGKDAKVYESAYNVMREADDAVKYAKQKRLMTAMEAGLTPEQKAQLRALDNSEWDRQIAEALEVGDGATAADLAITRAVEEVPIGDVATPEIKAEAAKIKEATQPVVSVETPKAGAIERVTVPAFRAPDGRIFQGQVHVLAHEAALAAGVQKLGGGTDGFMTSTGRFVGRDEATKIAETAEQIDATQARNINTRIAKGFDALDMPLEARKGIAAKEIEAETRDAVKKAITDGDLEALANKVFADVSRRRDATIAGLRESWKPEFKAMREAEAVELSDLLPAQRAVPDEAPAVTKNAAIAFARMSEAAKKLIEEEGGTIATRQAARLGLAGASAGVYSQVDEEHSGFTNTSLRAVAGFLGLAAAIPGPRSAEWLRTSKLTRNLIKWADFGRYATADGREGADLWHSITSESRAGAVLQANKLHRMLAENPNATVLRTNEVLNRNFGFAADEGQLAPEFHLLTPDQQKEALSLRMMNDNVGQWMKANGYISDVKENYFKHILPDETFEKWNAQRKLYLAQGNTAAVQAMETIRGAQQYAKLHNLPEPIKNVADAQAKHMIDVGRMVASHEAEKFFTARNLLLDNDPLARPNDWRVVKGTSKMAPDDVATALERIKSPSFSIAFVDPTRAVMMKSIMIFPWEHGINLVRAQMAFDPTLQGYRHALQQITAADPVVLEVSKYAQLFRQPDMLNEANDIFTRVLDKSGLGFLKPYQHAADKALWERWAPAVGISAWTLEMKKWGQRTGYRYLKGSPEYEAAARAAGKFANDAMGKIPDLVQDPKLAASMRLLLFSPAWLRTRMSIVGHAAGDLQKLTAGEMKWSEATYLKYKMKAVAYGMMFTWALSKVWGKEDPQFNPNTTKLYARTGLYDDRGRELGVDLVGWWQDDLKLFNDPWTFLEHRMNPMLRSTYQQIHGTDAFGNELTGMERYENLFRQMGPLTSIPETIINAASGDLTSRQAVKQGSEFLAVGNVSSLPRVQDVVLAKYAEKIIRSGGLPVRREDVYEVTKLMKQNHRQSGSLYGNNIKSWLAYKLRSYPSQHPISSLWYRGKQLLAETFDQ